MIGPPPCLPQIQQVKLGYVFKVSMIVFGEHPASAQAGCPQDGGGMKWFGTKDDYLALHKQWVTDAQAKWFTRDDFD